MTEINLPLSKSMINRANILASYTSEFGFFEDESCEDVTTLLGCLKGLGDGPHFLKEGGTSYRFLLARLSRIPGSHQIHASEQLMRRPHESLYKALKSLDVEISCDQGVTVIKSGGWQDGLVEIDCSKSSQYLSSVLLNSLDLPFELRIKPLFLNYSRSYFELTWHMMKRAGVEIYWDGEYIIVPAESRYKKVVECEIDLSSAFAIAAVAVLAAPIVIKSFPQESIQPDREFISILGRLGVEYKLGTSGLEIKPGFGMIDLDFELTQTTDIFPVLSALCATKKGCSFSFDGLAILKHKESNRLDKVIELLKSLDVQLKSNGENLILRGGINFEKRVVFNPDNDHRMAMAAAVLKSAGAKVDIIDKGCVAKSYPDFWSDYEAIIT